MMDGWVGGWVRCMGDGGDGGVWLGGHGFGKRATSGSNMVLSGHAQVELDSGLFPRGGAGRGSAVPSDLLLPRLSACVLTSPSFGSVCIV